MDNKCKGMMEGTALCNMCKMKNTSPKSNSEINWEEEFKDCRNELCLKCRSQSFFDDNWCKECRWSNY